MALLKKLKRNKKKEIQSSSIEKAIIEEERRKNHNKYKRYKRGFFHPWIFIAVFGMTVLCICLDVDMFYKAVIQELLSIGLCDWMEEVIRGLCLLLPNDLERNGNVFFAVWSISFALAVFVIEMSNSYHCGISLKRITIWQWGKYILLGEAEYLLLGPLIYFCNNLGWKITSFWCVILSFAGMAYMLAYVQCYMRIDIIQELVIDKTGEMFSIWKEEKHRITRSRIDMLPVAEMMEHINYEKKNELQILLDTLGGVIRTKNSQCREISIENTLIATWVRHIISDSGIATDIEKERTLNLLAELWRQVMSEAGTSKERQSYSIQILIPFIDMGGEDATDMLLRVWKTMGQYSHTSVIYLLLYTEYCYWYVGDSVHRWLRTDDKDMLNEFEKINRGEVAWDEEMAWQYWMDWSQYECLNGDIGVKQFENFSQNVKVLQKGKREQMKISILSCI